jgi:FkbM family methyltransferase
MNRELATFKEGEAHVKISHFTKKGMDIRGIIHVGTNDWYEYQFYKKMGIDNLIGFEPLPEAVKRARKNYPDAEIYDIALGAKDEFKKINVTSGDGQSSSMLPMTFAYQESFPDIKITEERTVRVRSFASWKERNPEFNIKNFNCLVIDVEGMELDVLRGFYPWLTEFKMLNVECSGEPTYEGGPTANEIIAYLKERGFTQDSPVEAHNDVMFVREDLE